MRLLRLLIAGSATAILCIPVDFVELTAWASALSLIALGIGAFATILLWASGRPSPGNRLGVLAAVAVLFALNLTISPNVGAALVTILVVVCALGFASLPDLWVFRTLLTVFCIAAVSICVDYLAHRHVVSGFFGVPFQQSFAGDEFRSRGVLGQAVPAGVISTIWAFYLIGRRDLVRRPGWLVAGVTLAIGAGVIMSGTRTALALALLGVVLLMVLRLRPTTRVPPGLFLAAVAGAIGMVWLGGSRLGDLRVFSLSGIEGTDSYQVRSLAGYVVDTWWARCDEAQCRSFGLGFRDLLGTLQGELAGSFTTVDNQYVSLLWDFGFAGLVVIAIALVVLVRRLRGEASSRAAATAGLLVLAGGWLFDVLYLRPGLFTFCFLLAIAVAAPRQAKPSPPMTLAKVTT